MNKRIQKLLSVLVAVLLLVSALPVTALAGSSTEITANVKHPHTVTVLTPHPGGQVLVVAPTTIYEDDEVSFTATPDSGYALKSIVWYTTDPTKATDITEAKKLTVPNADVTVKVEFAALCTVSFDMQGHGTQVSPITGVMDGTTVTAPAAPTAGGYTFGGWYKDADCKTAWNFGTDTVTKDITLYAKWIADSIPKKAIGGNVTEDGKNVPGATVELFLGTVKVAATVTDKNGRYSFENVENGTYNIVVTKEDGKTKTEMVTISGSSATVDVELPVSEINSKVEHKGSEVPDAKSDISKTVVGDLDKVAEKHVPEKEGDKVTIKLTVEPKADENTPAQQSIKEEAGDVKKVEFLDLSLLMQTNNEKPVNIGDKNDTLLTIIIPFDFTNVDVTSVMILRNHGGKTEKLTAESNKDGEYVQINEAAGNITLCVMKFSDYAVAYEEVTQGDDPGHDPGALIAAGVVAGTVAAKGIHDVWHRLTEKDTSPEMFHTSMWKIDEVKVDGEVVDSKDYTVKNGTVILSKEYLETLDSGEHTLTAENGLRTNCSNFKVDNGTAMVESSDTGDIGVMLYAGLAVAATLGSGIVIRRKKREE